MSVLDSCVAWEESKTLAKMSPSWACLNVESYIDPQFRQIVSSEEQFASILEIAQVTFCGGLNDAIQADSPPSLQFLRSLPDDIPKRSWGVYVLMLEKDGRAPSIYVGNGTSATWGIKALISDHHHASDCATPRYVQVAKHDGYALTHHELLVLHRS